MTQKQFISSALLFGLLWGSIKDAPAQITAVLVGQTKSAEGGYALGVATAGHYAYVAGFFNPTGGMLVCDISNPSKPIAFVQTNIQRASFSNAPNGGIALSGNYAYLAMGGSGLIVANISIPTNAFTAGQTNNGGSALGIAVAGNYAYLANGSDGLRTYDISVPSNVINIGHTNNGGIATGLAVSNNYLYLANGPDGLRVYDISNPAYPVNTSHTNTGSQAMDIVLSGNYAYVANSNNLAIYDLSIPANPVAIVQTNLNLSHHAYTEAVGIAVSGNYVYCCGDGLRIYDVSVPSHPVLVAYLFDGQTIFGGATPGHRVSVSGHYVFEAKEYYGLLIYSLEPQLKLQPAPSNTLQFAWPAPAPFLLQQSSGLGATNWVTLTNVPAAFGSSNQVVISAPTNNSFYRLTSSDQ